MGLTEDWKKAQQRFELVTSKRKPSEEFLGVFRDRHEIAASLERADAAKTAAELRHALDEFQKEVAAYTKALRAAAADPKCVPPEDAPTYVANTASLEKAVAKLMATGAKKAASLDGSDKVVEADSDPKIVVGRLFGINKELVELGVWVAKKLSTVMMNLEKQKAAHAQRKAPNENMVRGITMVRDAELKARETVEAKDQNLADLEKRVRIISAELHDDPEVASPLEQFAEAAAKVKADLASVKAEQKAYIDFLNECIAGKS
ncbi:MAG TPA: hypothetical protein VGM54_13040 [Chthoniobacter sp.]|jgi:hypothetical protein